MPSIKIESKTQLAPQEAFQRVKEMLANDPGLKKLDSTYQCSFNDGSCEGTVKGKQFSADIEVQPKDNGSVVSIEVDLAFLLSPFKGQVKSTLERKLEAALS
jgi:hypothetical protein